MFFEQCRYIKCNGEQCKRVALSGIEVKLCTQHYNMWRKQNKQPPIKRKQLEKLKKHNEVRLTKEDYDKLLYKLHHCTPIENYKIINAPIQDNNYQYQRQYPYIEDNLRIEDMV